MSGDRGRADQIALPLAWRSAGGERDFYVSSANERALAQLERWPDWPQRALVLVGPEASGKSHLARIFARRAPEVHIVDPADTPDRDEERIFHLWNAAQVGQGGLLLVARAPAAQWKIRLPDLRSRLIAAPMAYIEAPDDLLLSELAAKHFRDRGLLVQPNVLMYMVARMERSFAGVAAATARIDAAAMAGRRAVTVPLVRQVLEAMETETEGDDSSGS